MRKSLSGIFFDNFNLVGGNKQVGLWALRNSNGSEICITNYGARMVSAWFSDRQGVFEDVILGFSNIVDYLDSDEPYHGATIGRVANRIANGKFMVDGVEFNLGENIPKSCLHGGFNAFHNAIWSLEEMSEQFIKFSHISAHLESGFPGEIRCIATFSLNDDDCFSVKYECTSDRKTILGMTYHPYFNLSGKGKIFNHEVFIDSNYFIDLDSNGIPTGVLQRANGIFNLKNGQDLGKVLSDSNANRFVGYDHAFILNESKLYDAKAIDKQSGRCLTISSNQPALQFYTAAGLSGKMKNKNGETMGPYSAFCLEPGPYTDAPNHSNFDQIVLEEGQNYLWEANYKFDIY